MEKKMNEDDFTLPHWAIRHSDGDCMVIGTQLMTKDGRKCGNAYVDGIEEHDKFGKLAIVVTDMRNIFRMTLNELEEAFYPPLYVMDIEEARVSRGIET